MKELWNSDVNLNENIYRMQQWCVKYTIEAKEASEVAGVHIDTIYRWCRKYGIGILWGGRWRIVKKRFAKFLNGVYDRRLNKKPTIEETTDEVCSCIANESEEYPPT
jgi:hypothetical protein